MKKVSIWIGVGILIYAFILGLSGVSLVDKNADASAGGNQPIGVLITTEYLDLFDFEGYMNDHINEVMGGEHVILDHDRSYDGRLYAKKIEESYTDEETGTYYSAPDFVFEGMEGVAYFVAYTQDKRGESHLVNGNQDGVIDGKAHHNITDEEERTELDGTIYVIPEECGEVYFNPIFQDEDGNVYVMSGSGFDYSGAMSEGDIYGQTMESSNTTKVNGVTKKVSVKVSIQTSLMYAPQKITLIQMNEEDQVIAKEEYSPDQMIESFQPQLDTAYMIVETTKKSPEGTESIERAIFGREDESFTTYQRWKHGILKKHTTTLDWK